MQAGGILAERIGQYITEWSIMKLQGAAPIGPLPPGQGGQLTPAQQSRVNRGLPALTPAQERRLLQPAITPPLPPLPAPQPPAPVPNIFGPRSQVIPPAVPELPELPPVVPPAVTQRPEDLPPPFGTRGIV